MRRVAKTIVQDRHQREVYIALWCAACALVGVLVTLADALLGVSIILLAGAATAGLVIVHMRAQEDRDHDGPGLENVRGDESRRVALSGVDPRVDLSDRDSAENPAPPER